MHRWIELQDAKKNVQGLGRVRCPYRLLAVPNSGVFWFFQGTLLEEMDRNGSILEIQTIPHKDNY